MSIPTTWVGTTEIRELEIVDGNDGMEYLYLRPPGTMLIGRVERSVEVRTARAKSSCSRL